MQEYFATKSDLEVAGKQPDVGIDLFQKSLGDSIDFFQRSLEAKIDHLESKVDRVQDQQDEMKEQMSRMEARIIKWNVATGFAATSMAILFLWLCLAKTEKTPAKRWRFFAPPHRPPSHFPTKNI